MNLLMRLILRLFAVVALCLAAAVTWIGIDALLADAVVAGWHAQAGPSAAARVAVARDADDHLARRMREILAAERRQQHAVQPDRGGGR